MYLCIYSFFFSFSSMSKKYLNFSDSTGLVACGNMVSFIYYESLYFFFFFLVKSVDE